MGCHTLARHDLVVYGQGNVSIRDEEMMLIKASGAWCHTMWDGLVVAVDLKTGAYAEGDQKPSTDSDAHRYIYNHIPDIDMIVHTHSTYATAWAVAGKAIPCCSTAQSDVFGGDIPCSAYCPIGGDDIGQEIVRLYEFDPRRRAFLIRQHGVFTIGKGYEAVQAAVLTERFAITTLAASRLAGLKLIPPDEMKANYERYHTSYGQSRSDPEGDSQPARVGSR